MSHVLITGNSSYIGRAFAAYLRENTAHSAEGISLRGHAWETLSFAAYDTIFHAAGLTHVKETAQNASEYYEINRDLTLAVARKAKAELGEVKTEEYNSWIYTLGIVWFRKMESRALLLGRPEASHDR